MSEFQTVRRRGHQPQQAQKYADQHQKLTEMGFDSNSVSKALESTQGDLEAATIILLGEDRSESKQEYEYEEKVETKSSGKGPAANSAARPKESIKETHQKMMATYKVNKCKDNGPHDKRVCPNWHTISDRRRNPFEYNYSCFDCPNVTSGTGECKDGDNCPHSHTMLEKMFHPELYKISMCQRTIRGEKCDRGTLCAFAHSDPDLRVVTANPSSKPVSAPPTKPIPPSAKLNAILEKIIVIIQEFGPEGASGTEISKKYESTYHEILKLEDESKEKHNFRDVVGGHPKVSVLFNRGAPPRYVYDENKPAASSAPEETTDNSKVAAVDPEEAAKNESQLLNTIRDRLFQVIKASGSEGILGSDLPKKYFEMFGEKLDALDESGSKMKLKDIIASNSEIQVQMLKLQPKYVFVGQTTPAPASKPAASSVSYSSVANATPAAQSEKPTSSVVVTGKSYSAVAAALKKEAAAPAPVAAPAAVETKAPAPVVEAPPAPANNVPPSPNLKSVQPPAAPVEAPKVDESAPSAKDPIFTEEKQVAEQVVESNPAPQSFSEITFQSAFGYGSVPVSTTENSLGQHTERKPEAPAPLMGAPGLTKIHNQTTLNVDATNSLSAFIGNASNTNSISDFHERLNVAQSQVATLQQQINKLQSELVARNSDYEGQTLQLRNVMQRLAEAENKTTNSDEHLKLQLKTKTDELTQKTRDFNKVDDELRKIREERKNDLNQFFVNLSSIEEGINILKNKEENYSDKIRPEDVQELLQFKKSLKTFVTQVKQQLKQKFDQLTLQKPLEIEAAMSTGVPVAGNVILPHAGGVQTQTSRYVPTQGAYDQYYLRNDTFGAAYNPYAQQVVDTGLCALPGCRNQGIYTCAGCQKVSYCGAEHQR